MEAFLSHSRRDLRIVNSIYRICEQARIRPHSARGSEDYIDDSWYDPIARDWDYEASDFDLSSYEDFKQDHRPPAVRAR